VRPYYPHQVPAHEYAIQHDKIALFMDMRLGKTIVLIRWLIHKQPRTTLIVAPLSVCYGWMEELELEGLLGRSIFLRGSIQSVKAQLDMGMVNIYVTNYDSLSSRPQILKESWDCIVLDESTAIRNPKAKRTKLLIRSCRHVPLKAILTGLPNPQSAMDYCEQFRFLYGEFMGYGSYWNLRQSCQHLYGPYDWFFNPGVRRRIHQFVKKMAFIQTRKQAGMDVQKIREIRYLELPANTRTAYQKAEDEYVLGDTETKWAPHVQSWIRQLCGGGIPEHTHHVKADELISLMKGELANEQLVVWFAFRKEMSLVERHLVKHKFTVTHIHGDTGPALRNHRRLSFQRGDYDVILCQVDCAGIGPRPST